MPSRPVMMLAGDIVMLTGPVVMPAGVVVMLTGGIVMLTGPIVMLTGVVVMLAGPIRMPTGRVWIPARRLRSPAADGHQVAGRQRSSAWTSLFARPPGRSTHSLRIHWTGRTPVRMVSCLKRKGAPDRSRGLIGAAVSPSRQGCPAPARFREAGAGATGTEMDSGHRIVRHRVGCRLRQARNGPDRAEIQA